MCATEDRAISELGKRSLASGQSGIADGEFRRDWWQLDFPSHLGGETLTANAGQRLRFAGREERPPIASLRAGRFEPLKRLPAGKKGVHAVVTTKQVGLEAADNLKRRVEKASGFLLHRSLCLSPQSGLSSTHHGNALSADDQWRKLGRVVEVAQEVWGG